MGMQSKIGKIKRVRDPIPYVLRANRSRVYEYRFVNICDDVEVPEFVKMLCRGWLNAPDKGYAAVMFGNCVLMRRRKSGKAK